MDEHKRYCKNCGGEIRTESNYCPHCGLGFNNTSSQGGKPQKTLRKGLFARSNKHSMTKGNISNKIPKTKTITETRCTCNVCGKIWHYCKQEQLESAGAAMQNLGKSVTCCSGCAPAALIPDKKVTDLNKCPECGSKNIRKEQIAREVAR